MPKIVKLRCALCGREHNCSVVAGLVTKGWYAASLSKAGGSAKYLICPECLQRIYGRKLEPGEFGIPE